MPNEATDPTFFMPIGASTFARPVDDVFYFVYWVSVVFFVLIVGAMTYFVIRYRRKSEADTTPHISHNTPVEVAWSVGPLFLLAIMFVWGFRVYMELRAAPRDAMQIYVTAEQWRWIFTYPNGTVTNMNFAVPVNEPVKLVMSSNDVLHAFYAPAFRQKMDVLPNRYTTTWFQANKVGEYDLFCAEYCGDTHSGMIGKISVLEPAEYATYLETGGLGKGFFDLPLPEQGKFLFTNIGCNQCHNVDGTKKVGPHLNGVFGHQVAMADGSSVLADENYIRQSIVNPSAHVVAGFPDAMPKTFSTLKEEKINALVEYIKSLQ